MISKLLPNFKATFYIVGITFMLLPLSLFSKGLMKSMAEFKVPNMVLLSAHYFDAILWVYIHMMVLGFLIFFIGHAVTEVAKQKWISLFLFIINCIYTFLDFRSADWTYGNSLYQGDSSLAPAFIGTLTCLLFLQLTLKLWLFKEANSNNIAS